MTLCKITKVDEYKAIRNREGQKVSTAASIHLMAPTKRGDEWSIYLAVLTVQRDGKISFRITHINSSAWGNPSWRAPPIDYTRPDIEKFVRKECTEVLQKLQSMLVEDS